MGWIFREPGFADAELQRRAGIAMAIVRAVAVAVLLVVGLSLAEPANDVRLTLALYVPVLLVLAGCASLLQRGYVTLVGWVVSLSIWAIVSVVLALFGGLQAHNATPFVIAVTIAGTVVSGRAAVLVGLLSVLSALGAFLLELTGRLPAPLAPLTSTNSLISVTVSLLLAGTLLALSLSSLQRALRREREAAAQRDLAQAAAVRAQQLESVGRLAAGVAHDLNNLLAIIQLTSDELSQRAKADPALGPVADDLQKASEAARLLSRRMVGMSRAEGSKPEPLELGDVVTKFEPLLRRLLPPECRLGVTLEANLELTASRSALEHVLLNLVLNARDAMPKGGAIEVVVTASELSVKDTGVGMPPEVRAQLFRPFFTTRKTGTGLGLVNVAELASAMGATVEVESEVGRGSTFRLRFSPRAEGADTLRTDAVPTKVATATIGASPVSADGRLSGT
ncbi:MAG: hypothetical protein JNJ54_14940 [Myxococcaceae bacterium]|nr:hypothetical protein [Myxococcaceae bacterium]